MEGLQIENTNTSLVLSIDKENFSESVLLNVIKIARVVIGKADFDESVLQLDKEMKETWWQENKNELLRKAGQ